MELNPFSYDFHEDPYPTYRWLRDNAPVYHNDDLSFWALTRYRDVFDASLDWATYSSAQGVTVERIDPKQLQETPMMIMMDPPEHDRLRGLVNRVFTPRRVGELEDFIRSLTKQLLEPLAADGGGDFVKDLSALLPMEVIFTLLGVPDGDRRQLRRWIDLSLDRDHDSPSVPDRAIEAMIHLGVYWKGFVDEMRGSPNDGLIAALTTAELDGERLTTGEIMGFALLLGAAGNETVTKLLANACVLFARNPDQWRIVRNDASTLPSAVEEVLRYSSPSQYQGRMTTREVELHGVTIPANERVLLVTGSANRDEREFPDPDRFDVLRPSHVSLGLGHGIHFCIGAHLARLESRVALEEFGARFPEYTVDESKCVRVHMSNVHGYESVPFSAGS
ncbi:MAG: cytochrome P450 [Acidimicrobiia bacterium]